MATLSPLLSSTTSAIDLLSTLNLQQLQYDDVAAIVAVSLASLAYVTSGTLWNRPDPYRYKLFERPQQHSGRRQVAQQTRDIAERLAKEECDVGLLWASQSGTAERLAGRLSKELSRDFGARVLSLDVSDIEPASLANLPNNKLVIFMVSTFGEGDPSDNMHQMWSWFKESNDIDLPNLRYLAFGFGNSNYKHYNHVVDVVVAELSKRGAQMLMPTSKADDATGETNEHFLQWKDQVFDLFQATLGYERQESRYEPSIEILEDASATPDNLWNGSPYISKSSSAQSSVCSLPIVRSRELLNDTSDRNCLHVELDISQHPNLKYKTGDYLAVWPENPAQEVERLLRALGLEAKRATPMQTRSLDGSSIQIPSLVTLEQLFRTYLEICAPVPRDYVALLASYAPTPEARALLMQISRDKTAYSQYLSSRYVNIGRLLEAACPTSGAWSRLPLSLVLETLPTMQPRFYSISSSSVVSSRQVAITVAVSDTSFPESADRIIGIASNHLLAAKEGHHPRGLAYSPALGEGRMHAAIRKSNFKLPTMSSAPIVMVGAGTGVAPFRAFVQERARLKSIGRTVGATKLFFGCRNSSQDFLYGDEFSQWTESLGHCFSLTTAFSRDGLQKRYVQDAILDDAEAICRLLIDENAYFYICGSAAMARDVSSAIAKIMMARQDWSEDQMKGFADRQKRHKRWFQDVWG